MCYVISLFLLLCVPLFFYRHILHSHLRPPPFFPTRIKTNSTQFHEILPDNLAEGMRNEGCAAGDHAESQKQSTGHNHSPGSHDDEFVSCSRRHCKKVFTACVFIDYHKKGSHLMSAGWSCGRRTKAISVTLHAILHASKPTILSRVVYDHSEQQSVLEDTRELKTMEQGHFWNLF